MSGRAPFWSDDFDMDLLKVLPDTEELLGQIKDMPLYTHGATWRDRLNHPSVWNGDRAMLAFFGLAETGFKPAAYWTNEPVVECTVLEAFRDAWPHDYLLQVDLVPVWDTFALSQPVFFPLMYHRRGVVPLSEEQHARLINRLRRSIVDAVEVLSRTVLGVRP